MRDPRRREQPEEHRRLHPAGQAGGAHGRVRLGQVVAAGGGALQALAQVLHGARERAGRPLRPGGRGAHRQDHQHRPEPHRPHARAATPRTYMGVFDEIRKLFAGLPESKVRGYRPGRFSFNVKGGRCEACQGQGQVQIEMQFLPDMFVPCDVCHGARFNRETLQVRYKGKNIAEVLDTTIDEALVFFEAHPGIRRKLKTLQRRGPGLHPHRPAGHHALRRRGPAHQAGQGALRRSTGRTLYMLDEPSAGLHAADVHKLVECSSASSTRATPCSSSSTARHHQGRRLDHRPGPRRRRPRRLHRGRRHAGGSGESEDELYGAVFEEVLDAEWEWEQEEVMEEPRQSQHRRGPERSPV